MHRAQGTVPGVEESSTSLCTLCFSAYAQAGLCPFVIVL